MKAIMIYMTASSMQEAELIAEKLVEQRLCAGVNLFPEVKSIYHWKGNVQREKEVALFVQSKENLLSEITALVKSLHSYDCPAIASFSITGGNPDYLDWIKNETKQG